MLNVTTMHYVLGIWFVGPGDATPGADCRDWLGCVYQAHARGAWIGQYRVHAHRRPPPCAPHACPSWERVTVAACTPEATLLTSMRHVASLMALRNRTVMHEVLVRGNGQAAGAALARQPWGQRRLDAARHKGDGWSTSLTQKRENREECV